MSVVKLNISGASPETLVSRAETVISNMTGNANFPSPTPSIAEVTVKKDELNEWIVKSAFGDRQAISMRKEKYDQLYELLTRLGGYVGSAAGSNTAMIMGSGFSVRKASTPAPPVTPPIDVRAERTSHNGRIKVQWSPVAGSKSYVTEMTTTDPVMPGTVWQTVAYTSRAVVLVDNLTTGQFYWFRVKAIGTRDNSGFSDVALVMAA